MKNITCFNLSFLVKFFLIFIYICVHSSCSQKNFNYANASNHSKIKADASIHKKINDFSSKINEKKKNQIIQMILFLVSKHLLIKTLRKPIFIFNMQSSLIHKTHIFIN